MFLRLERGAVESGETREARDFSVLFTPYTHTPTHTHTHLLLHWVFVGGTLDSLLTCTGLSYSSTCKILVPRPEIEPVSPVLEGRTLTTEPLENF